MHTKPLNGVIVSVVKRHGEPTCTLLSKLSIWRSSRKTVSINSRMKVRYGYSCYPSFVWAFCFFHIANLTSRLLSRLFAVEILKSLDHKNIINAYVNREELVCMCMKLLRASIDVSMDGFQELCSPGFYACVTNHFYLSRLFQYCSYETFQVKPRKQLMIVMELCTGLVVVRLVGWLVS